MNPVYPDLAGRHVVITGGSNGIGAALCRAFAGQGCRVSVLDRDADRGAEVVAECSTERADAALYPVDLCDSPGLCQVLERLRTERPPVDVIVANAGYDPRYELLDMSDQEWSSLFELNVTHYFVLCRELLPQMIERGVGGSVIMTASHTAWLGKPDLIAYNTTKAAVIGLVRSLAEAVGKHHIRVNAVAPGWTMTDRQLRQWVTPEAQHQTVHGEQAMPLVITPDELVGTYLFLASCSSRPLTRQVLVADAGQAKH